MNAHILGDRCVCSTRSAGVGGIPSKCHQRQGIRFACQVRSGKAPSNPRFITGQAPLSHPPGQKIQCASGDDSVQGSCRRAEST